MVFSWMVTQSCLCATTPLRRGTSESVWKRHVLRQSVVMSLVAQSKQFLLQQEWYLAIIERFGMISRHSQNCIFKKTNRAFLLHGSHCSLCMWAFGGSWQTSSHKSEADCKWRLDKIYDTKWKSDKGVTPVRIREHLVNDVHHNRREPLNLRSRWTTGTRIRREQRMLLMTLRTSSLDVIKHRAIQILPQHLNTVESWNHGTTLWWHVDIVASEPRHRQRPTPAG